MSFKKIFISSALTMVAMGFVACGDSDSSSNPSTTSTAEIQTIDEDAQIVVYTYEDEWCSYSDGDLTWKSETKTKAYQYAVGNDTLVLFSYDIKKKAASSTGRVFVGGGNSLKGTWTQANCSYDDDEEEMYCEEGNDSYIVTMDIGSSKIEVSYRINPDFNYTSSYMIRDLVYAIIDGEDVEADDWTEYKRYDADYFEDEKEDHGLAFDVQDKNNLDITIDGLTYKVRNASATISNEKEQVSVSVSAGGSTCELSYVYNNVTENTCNYKNILNLNIYEDEAYGYLEENEEEFSECLHKIYKKNRAAESDLEKSIVKTRVKDHPVNKIPVFSIPVAK